MSKEGEKTESNHMEKSDGKKPVVIAMDGSEHADYAFHCELKLLSFSEQMFMCQQYVIVDSMYIDYAHVCFMLY